jgi:hypothetical protein
MPDIRNTPRAIAAALVDGFNALVDDATAIVAGDKPMNSLRGRSALTKIIADLLAVRTPIAATVIDVAALQLRHEHMALVSGAIANGTTAGKLKTAAAITYTIGGTLYTKAITDDLWNLSAEVDTDGTHYRAYWLYLDSSGTASFAAGTDALTSAANAIAALPAITTTKSVIGVYVAGPSTDFNGAGGLAGQGTIYNGFAAPYVLTAAAPAAMTATTSLGIGNGTTAGKLRTNADTEYVIAGTFYRKVPTDNLWDLSAEVDTIAAKYRAYVLYLDASGVATFAASDTDGDDADEAIANLPERSATKAIVGMYVAGPETDFDDAGGLAAQGTITDGATGSISAVVSAEAITLVAP